MWNLFNCYLSGRHDYGMWCEPGQIFLRCMHCGKRSTGWSVGVKEAVTVTTSHPTVAASAHAPARIVPFPRITKEELKQRLDSGVQVVVVDARLKYPYEHSTVKLPGAVRVVAGAPVPALPRDREIVVYDSDPNELASTDVAAELIRQGYRAAALKGGITEWLAANLPTETKDAPKQAPPEPGALKA